jgi:hypothetical protein
MQRHARAPDLFYQRLASRVDFVQVRRTKWLLSRSRENDVTNLQIAHRPIVGGRKRVKLFCDAQRCLADFVVGTNVSDDDWINRITENHDRVIAHLYWIGATGKRARHHDERIGRADQETELFQRANLGTQFGDRIAQVAFALGCGTCLRVLVFCAFQSLFSRSEIRVGRVRFLFPTITGGRFEIRRRSGPGRQAIGIGTIGVHIHLRLEEERLSMSFRMLNLQNRLAIEEIMS